VSITTKVVSSNPVHDEVYSIQHYVSHPHIPSPATSSLSQVPDHIQEILQYENTWEFDIIELERVTNKRFVFYEIVCQVLLVWLVSLKYIN
jgi:hypothetical protein